MEVVCAYIRCSSAKASLTIGRVTSQALVM